MSTGSITSIASNQTKVSSSIVSGNANSISSDYKQLKIEKSNSVDNRLGAKIVPKKIGTSQSTNSLLKQYKQSSISSSRAGSLVGISSSTSGSSSNLASGHRRINSTSKPVNNNNFGS